ncbi:MAG: hypothetical protein A2204_08210 [Elusimicrobia bacterium RIFOXYA1_FULL_47_7]|nr:MAG: hypothetical protein A2204_08210 [Elusimicrobia bacterium RIFOXYA1_FULL_47_7]
MFERLVPQFSETLKLYLNNLVRILPCYFNGFIGAERIRHNYLAGPLHALQAVPELCLFVVRDNIDRYLSGIHYFLS